MDQDTKYRFFPVVRRGYPPQQYYDAKAAKGQAAIDTSGRLEVDFSVTGSGGAPNKTDSSTVAIDMYGPEHVTGLDSRQVIRMEPEPGTTNFSPNYLATVEFEAPDLPWLFSPVSDDTYAPDDNSTPQEPKGRGLPWLCLVVVEKTNDTSVEAAGTKPLPSLEVPVEELPPLDEAWAWVHGQTVGSPSQKSGDSLKAQMTPPSGTSASGNSGQKSGYLLKKAFGSQSNLTRSRLVSPRNLRANGRYIAAVVPVFEAGRKAGLGQAVETTNTGNDNSDGSPVTMSLAWDPTKTSAAGGSSDKTVTLPLYHHWEFSTGVQGDFEFLARELEPVNLNTGDYDIGFTDVDVTEPGPAILDDLWTASRADRTIRLGGALRQANSSADEYVKDDELRELLNRPAEIEEVRDESDHVVGPPIYGGRHAQVEELPTQPPADQQWLSTLNLHPGWRLAAAIGTGIVRDRQEQLMASAWEQVGTIREANRLLAAAQLSRETMEGKLRILDGTLNAWLAQFTAPMHDRVMTDNQTIGAYLDDSSTPRALTSTPFRRLMGGSGRLVGRLETSVNGPGLLAGVVEGSVDVTSPKDAPDGMGMASEDASVRELCQRFGDWDIEERAESVQKLLDRLNKMTNKCSQLSELLSEMERVLNEGDSVDPQYLNARNLWTDIQIWTVDYAPSSSPLWSEMRKVANDEADYNLPTVNSEYTLATAKDLFNTIEKIARTRLLPGYRLNVKDDPKSARRYVEDDVEIGGLPDIVRDDLNVEDIQEAQKIVSKLVAALANVESYLHGEEKSDLAYLGTLACAPDPAVPDESPPNLRSVTEAPDPVTGLIGRIQSQLDGIDLLDRGVDPLDRVMAYPKFPTPMYEDLKSVSEDYLLPGVEEVPKDSFGALETNPQFIESFMVGLNHEMASELRWQRYPTDRRGSYFRQFWNPSARIPKPDNKELLKDITEIHTWDDKGPNRQAASPLGSNVMTGATGDKDGTQPGQGSVPVTNVVVVIRGELLRRYPTTTIYATKAKQIEREDGSGTARVPEWPTAEETKNKVDDTYHRFPIFRGKLDPDVTFLGFDLTPEEATGEKETTSVDSDTQTDHLGWFFVLAEPPGEVRFGLDVNQDDIGERPNGVTYNTNGGTAIAKTDNPNENPERGWNGLSWGHLIESEDALAAKDNVSIYRDRPGEKSWRTIKGTKWTTDTNTVEDATIDEEETAVWGKNSAHMAYITWQRPVRIAIHADDLLPVDSADGNSNGEEG